MQKSAETVNSDQRLSVYQFDWPRNDNEMFFYMCLHYDISKTNNKYKV